MKFPRAVAVEMDPVSVGAGVQDLRELPDPTEVPEGAPRLTVAISAGLGEVRVDR